MHWNHILTSCDYFALDNISTNKSAILRGEGLSIFASNMDPDHSALKLFCCCSVFCSLVPTMVMWESSQWLGKNIVRSTGLTYSRKAWICALATAI